MAVATPTMQLAMTAQQRQSFDEQGFILIENFFNPAEFDRLLRAIDEVAERVRAEKGLTENDPFALRNALSHHEAFLDLIDNPRILPLVVDAIGWNIQIRTTHLDVRPPYPEGLEAGELGTGEGADHAAGYKNLVWHPDLAGPYLFEAPSLDGFCPPSPSGSKTRAGSWIGSSRPAGPPSRRVRRSARTTWPGCSTSHLRCTHSLVRPLLLRWRTAWAR